MFGESVHIVPVQREVEFVVEPAVEQGADVVHLRPDDADAGRIPLPDIPACTDPDAGGHGPHDAHDPRGDHQFAGLALY